MSEKVDKGKVVATVSQKRKFNMPLGPREKLMRDALNARTIGEGLETRVELAIGAMTGGRFVLAWRLGRDMSLATVAERKEWATFMLPPMVRAGFSKNNDKEIEARTNAAVVEVSL